MAFDDTVKSYLRLYSRADIETALKSALADQASGVTITGVSGDGGSTTGMINGNTDQIISILNACLERLDAGYPNDQVDQQVSHWDFSRQILGT
jgi:hypothetical protein